jgi:hypothetical protein
LIRVATVSKNPHQRELDVARHVHSVLKWTLYAREPVDFL